MAMNQGFMKRAIELAKNGTGFTSPNPCVGAVIVKGGKIIAEGWHKKAGGNHAEVIVIEKIMKKSGIVTMDIDPMLFQNADLYVTMEPCCHYGKTPPCCEIVAAAGFNKVYIGMIDPFKKVRGRGIKFLKNKGIKVEICKKGSKIADEVRDLNQPFIKWAKTDMPYVIMKAGMSLDGKIATSSGESKWITSEESRTDARLERSKCDAVLVGSGTVIADNPKLGTQGKYNKKNLLRVILDRKLSFPIKSKVFRDENVFVACTDMASKRNRAKFEKAGIEFRSFGKDGVSIKKLLKYLGKRDIQSVFVEGGSTVNGLFFDAALKDRTLFDKVMYYIAPKLIGGEKSLSLIGGEGASKISKAFEIKNFTFDMIVDDVKVCGILNSY